MDDAQVQAMVESWRKKLAADLDAMKLRQWCVEKAIESVNSGGERFIQERDGVTVVYDVPTLAAALLAFITAPFADTFRDAPPQETMDVRRNHPNPGD
jgi:hypothetical protein